MELAALSLAAIISARAVHAGADRSWRLERGRRRQSSSHFLHCGKYEISWQVGRANLTKSGHSIPSRSTTRVLPFLFREVSRNQPEHQLRSNPAMSAKGGIPDAWDDDYEAFVDVRRTLVSTIV